MNIVFTFKEYSIFSVYHDNIFNKCNKPVYILITKLSYIKIRLSTSDQKLYTNLCHSSESKWHLHVIMINFSELII